MIGTCTAFYLVKQNDGCWAIANQYNISLDNFVAWNLDVKSDCSGSWPNYYVCVGVKWKYRPRKPGSALGVGVKTRKTCWQIINKNTSIPFSHLQGSYCSGTGFSNKTILIMTFDESPATECRQHAVNTHFLSSIMDEC
jgi:LysM domain